MTGEHFEAEAEDTDEDGGEGPPAPVPPGGSVGDKPEADALEQAQPVGEQDAGAGPRRPSRAGDEVPEADWLEQSVAEPLDEEER